MPKNKPTYRISYEDALEAHEVSIRRYGGHGGVLREESIRSAIQNPYNGYYRRIHKKAGILLYSLVKNHGFVDGNKRTALLMAFLLLERSGYSLTGPTINDDIEHLILGIAEGRIGRDETIEWFKNKITKTP